MGLNLGYTVRTLTVLTIVVLVLACVAAENGKDNPVEGRPAEMETSDDTRLQRDLIVGVVSSPELTQRRAGVRKSWMRVASTKARERAHFFFFMIRPAENELPALRQENDTFGDMVWVDNGMTNAYSQLAYKTMALLQYVNSAFKYRFLLKVDDDTMILLDEWVRTIDRLPPDNLYFGRITYNSGPHRDPASKWYDPIFPEGQNYPPWAAGCGYVLSADVVTRITNIVNPPYFPGEDISVSVWVRDLKGVNIVHTKRIYNTHTCSNDFLALHYYSPPEMSRIAAAFAAGNPNYCQQRRS